MNHKHLTYMPQRSKTDLLRIMTVWYINLTCRNLDIHWHMNSNVNRFIQLIDGAVGRRPTAIETNNSCDPVVMTCQYKNGGRWQSKWSVHASSKSKEDSEDRRILKWSIRISSHAAAANAIYTKDRPWAWIRLGFKFYIMGIFAK